VSLLRPHRHCIERDRPSKDLRGDQGRYDQVAIPLGMLLPAAVRCDHHEIVVVHEVEEWDGVCGTRRATRCREEQHVIVDEPASDTAMCSPVHRPVKCR